jgi:Protein of unknown function (DUF1326)
MSWTLKGSYVETCSCDLICPCNANMAHGATYDYCRVVLAFNIREGEIEGTDVSGRKVAATADTPKVMTEGNWRIGVFVPFGVETGQPVRFQGMFHPVASDLTIGEATRSKINAFGIEYEGKTGLSYSEFSWAA